MEIAIVIVAYNRAETVARLLESLNNAHYSQEVPLIISIDKSNTNVVEQLADAYEWIHGPKVVVKHENNLGLRKHILSIGEYTKKFDAIVVLEDDLVVSPCFYDYALQTVSKYYKCPEIAGISLFSFPFNNYLSLPFYPSKDEYDVFLMQIAQSWGQIWMKDQWEEFIKWYENNNEEFGILRHLPSNICRWGSKSWLKYHYKYCIENKKYFVYPYTSLTSNSGAAGTHSTVATNINQTILQGGKKYRYFLPDVNIATKYDGFYESLTVETYLKLGDSVCIDLYGLKKNALNSRYWLTTERADFKILNTYGLEYYPIEENVLRETQGESIFLYDTWSPNKNPYRDNSFDIISYHFKIRGIYTTLKRTGFLKFLCKTLKVLIKKAV